MGAELPKVLLPLMPRGIGDETILARSVERFVRDAACQTIVVCIAPDVREHFERILAPFPQVLLVPGGETRQHSVRAGLTALAARGVDGSDVVLIHDAARCCVPDAVIHRVVEGVAVSGAATAAVPVVDSMVRAGTQGVETYVDRAQLWSVQTPQGFRMQDIVAAHEAAVREGVEGLDDASLVVRLRPVALVLGDRLNIKVTTPEDLELARVLVANGVVK